MSRGRAPVVIYRLDLGTARRDRIREIPTADPTGLVYTTPPQMMPDGRVYGHTCYRNLTDLYQIEIER